MDEFEEFERLIGRNWTQLELDSAVEVTFERIGNLLSAEVRAYLTRGPKS
jgi:hypothetical protein